MIAALLLAAVPFSGAQIPSDSRCEFVGNIVEYGDSTFTDQNPVEGFTIAILCPFEYTTVGSTGTPRTVTERIPLFIVLDDEQAQLLLDAAGDLSTATDVFLDEEAS